MRGFLQPKRAVILAALALLLQSVPALAAGEPGVALDNTALVLSAGGTAPLTPTVTLPEGSDMTVTWATSDAAVATVDAAGSVTALAPGAAAITATVAAGAYSATCAVTVKPAEIGSSVYAIDRAAGRIKGLSKFTPPGLLYKRLNNAPADLAILLADGTPFAGTYIGTGMTLTLTVNGALKDSLKLVVDGDANGDGAISVADYTMARLDILGLKPLADEYRAAADVNGDSQITITDYTLIRLDILGLKPIGATDDVPEVANERVKAMLDSALAMRGKPYVLGEEGPDAFDCSGLVYYSLTQAGYAVGRSTADTYSKNEKWPLAPVDALQPGDLLFFYSTDRPGVIGHVGIYMGDGNMIHASSSYGCVIVCPLSGWYTANLSHARRVFN